MELAFSRENDGQRNSLYELICTSAQAYDAYLGKLGLEPNRDIAWLKREMSAMTLADLVDLEARFSWRLASMAAGFPAVANEVLAGRKSFSRQAEIQSFKWALKKADLDLADPDFCDYFEEDDIIEVYSEQGVQLYRSWSCYRHCSYSVLELKLYDWDTLYQRPSWVAKTLWDMMPRLFEPGQKTIAYNIPEYVMTERLQKHNRRLLFRMKYASPLLDKSTGRTCAFVSTGHISLLRDASPSPDILIL
ncbi:MAG: hypothetical protein KF767_11245 [Bdellovibrionaceae bacterium]|nr:hypothetical protein [Pseudobdellovibrionaceae bacterium]